MSKSVVPRRPRGKAPVADSRPPLLARILDTPHLDRIVPQLHPQVLHRVVQSLGLEDSAEIVALATPAQLAGVFDVDLWRPAQPGLDEQFDAARFGLWLEVMAEPGPDVAAGKLAGMDVHLVIAAFAQFVGVFDPASFAPGASTEGDEMPLGGTSGGTAHVGGYLIVGKRADSWDAVVAVLSSLNAAHQAYFHQVMRGCRKLSNAGFELDGLDDLLTDQEQVMFDLAVSREQRREAQGYVTPPQARAFLQMARARRPGHGGAANPIAGAYFRAIDAPAVPDSDGGAAGGGAAAMVDVLLEAGLLPEAPRALLEGPQGPDMRLARIRALMQLTAERDPDAFSIRGQELAFLANTLAAGCSIHGRPFTAQEASDAAVATCNLALENWPADRPSLPDDFLVAHDLIDVFQLGWSLLHHRVCMDTAKGLIETLTALRSGDRETQAGLVRLRRDMAKQWRAGTPWEASGALDVLAILDMPAQFALAGLIAECPVVHAGMGVSLGSRAHEISATAFEFISETSQLASIGEFMRRLPETLRG